jgi:GT2 family glycosyltransferase
MAMAHPSFAKMSAENQPICSVCIANFNGMKFIDACIQSVLKQDFQGQIEIIVHDDASTDGSVAYIQEHYPNVTLIVSETNVGFCISNNRMVQVARGQYILLLNNDAELFPDAIKFFYSKAKEIGRPAILGIPQFDAETNQLIDIGSNFDLFLNPIPNISKNREEVGMIIGACFWLPRSLWDELGGFPEWFGSLAEDMFLCCVARLWGYSVIAISDSGFRHWVGQSLGGGKILNNKLNTKLSRRVISERNKSFVIAMTCPSPLIYFIFPLHLSILLLEGFAISLIKRQWNLFSSIYWACIKTQWKEKKKLLNYRNEIQRKRTIKISTYLKVFSVVPYKLKMFIKFGLPDVK